MDGSQTPADAHQHEDAAPEEVSDGDSDTSTQSPYDIQELAAIFIDFYRFLATLHYNPDDLKLPPPEGWDIALLPKAIVERKSQDVVELMRHLPYFRERETEKPCHVHYKSKLMDYTDAGQHGHAQTSDLILEDTYRSWEDDRMEGCSNLLVIAAGYESGGRDFILDLLHGEIVEEIIRYDMCGPVDCKEFFANLQEQFRSLKLIPCPGRETQEAARVPETNSTITEHDVRAQTEHWYPGTDLDWQFVRQVYRQHGWPDNFRRREAISFIDEFMARDKDRRDEWETAFH